MIPPTDAQPPRETGREGPITIYRCRQCSHTFYLPRNKCPVCRGTDLKALGKSKGVVYSFTVVDIRAMPKSVVMIVDVDGTKVKGNYLGDANNVKTGLRVKAVPVSQGSGFGFVEDN